VIAIRTCSKTGSEKKSTPRQGHASRSATARGVARPIAGSLPAWRSDPGRLVHLSLHAHRAPVHARIRRPPEQRAVLTTRAAPAPDVRRETREKEGYPDRDARRCIASKSTAEWLEIFDRHDVPAMLYHTLDSLLDDPHLADVQFFELKEHPTEGKIRNMRLPNKWSCAMCSEWSPAPKLGQDSVEVLREVGYTESRSNK
jgi:CoA-transferase family III